MWGLLIIIVGVASGDYPRISSDQTFISMNGYTNILAKWFGPGFAQQGRDWAGQCAEGTSQSPIDINERPANPSEYAVVTSSDSTFRPITFQNSPSIPQVDNMGMYNMYWVFSGSLSQEINGLTFEQNLAVVLFQSPAEHTLNGVTYPLGIMLGYVVPDASGAVSLAYQVYVLVREGARNPGIDQFLNEQPLDVSYFLPPGGVLDDYYFYSGSFDVPPCFENLKWVISNYIIEAAPDQIAYFQDLWVNDLSYSNGRGNIRAVQPLNGRTVYHFIPDSASFLG